MYARGLLVLVILLTHRHTRCSHRRQHEPEGNLVAPNHSHIRILPDQRISGVMVYLSSYYRGSLFPGGRRHLRYGSDGQRQAPKRPPARHTVDRGTAILHCIFDYWPCREKQVCGLCNAFDRCTSSGLAVVRDQWEVTIVSNDRRIES